MEVNGVGRAAGPLCFDRARLVRVRIPLAEPFRISSGDMGIKEAILLELSGEGVCGWGESSAVPGNFYSPETPESCVRELQETVLPQVLGRNFNSILDLDAVLNGITENRFARVAVETAAWEALARRRNSSICELLEVPSPGMIPCGLTVGLYETEAALLDAIHRLWRSDYRRLKIKIKRGFDVSLVKAVRREFGDIPLYVDANADYSRADFRIFSELDDYGLMMFEQPLAKDDLEGARLLQSQVKTPVCLDESVESAEEARRAIHAGACKIINIKIQRVGGFLEALRIMSTARSEGIALWLGTMPELGLGAAQALALCGYPGVVFPTDVVPSRRWYVDDIVEPELRMSAGGLRIAEGSGLGYRVSEAKLERYAGESWSLAAAE
jgi:o-succinylbenzoate synthase